MSESGDARSSRGAPGSSSASGSRDAGSGGGLRDSGARGNARAPDSGGGAVMSRMAQAAQRMERQERERQERERRDAAAAASTANDENAPPPVDPAQFEGMSLREKAVAMARLMSKAKDESAEVENQIANQREGRRPARRADAADREISDEVGRARAGEAEAAASAGNGAALWGRAKSAVNARRAAVHLANVNNDRWADADALFAYYNGAYFEGRLSEVTFSWINREEEDGEYRYCLCSAVPGWWHGEHKNLMCGVSCAIERRRGGAPRRSVHIRMPEAMRKFKLTNMTKEGMLHSMIHAYLFLTEVIKEHEPFYEHGPHFRAMMRRINNDTLTFDAFRPSGGYDIRFSDAGDVEFEDLLTQEMLDALTLEHFKILYLVSKYSQFAERVTDNERWVRFQPLLVLMYECIVAGVFDYDYAPASAMVSGKRIYLNVTQEGRDHLDDLVEARLVRALRTITEDKQPVVAYQITEEGLERLRTSPLTRQDRGEIDDVIRDPQGDLLMVSYNEDDEVFRMHSENAFCVDSTITETEDVSYVSSPYLPFTLRDLKCPMASNAHRASESATGTSNLKDELDVQLSLSRLVIMVGEWIPFGCNQIMELTQKLGVNDRVKGGYFSAVVDKHSTDTVLEVPVGLTKVSVNSCDMAQWINIEAEVEYPEDEGITQVENFGIRYQRDGTTLYGLKLEAVMEAVLNDISLDNLARVMTDIHIDSSKVTESLCSDHQGKLLSMVFNGNEMNRNKVNVFIAEKITPKLRALRYLDGDALEAELKQVIGDTQHAFDITENDVVIFGDAGVLFAGPECIQHETLLLAYLALKAREDFVTNFFNRLFIVAEQMTEQQRLINTYYEDPTHVNAIRNNLARINEDCIMLEEVMRNLESSMEADALPPERMPQTKAGKRLYHILQIPKMERSLRGRIQDCEKQVSATRNEIEFLSNQITNVMQALREQVNRTTKDLFRSSSEQMKLNDTSASRDVMQLIFAGSLSFGIIDRFTGEWSVVWDAWHKAALTYRLVLAENAAFFYVAMVTWAVVGASVLYYMQFTRENVTGTIHFLARLDAKVNVRKLFAYLRSKGVTCEDVVADRSSDSVMTEFAYTDSAPTSRKLWERYVPDVILTVDVRNGVLRTADITIVKPASSPARIFPRELQARLLADLERNDVLMKPKTEREVREASAAIVLVANQPPHAYDREVQIEDRTYAHLREQLALKFCFKTENLLRVVTSKIVEGVEVEEVIEDDQQVAALREYQRLEVSFRGRPDPGMSLYAAKLRKVQRSQAAGVKVGLRDTKNDRGKGPGAAPTAKKYGETFDEEDILYGDA